MYKDAPDGDSSEEEEDDQEMRGEQDSDAEGSDSDYDSEEEIKEIPLKALAEKSMRKKRARLGQG